MRKTVFLLASLFVMACGIQSVKAQTQTGSATANATATIVQAISITNLTDLRFGKIVADPTAAGEVAIQTDGTRTIAAGNVALVNIQGNDHQAASFKTSGLPGATYYLVLPDNGSVELTGPSGSTPMTIEGFVHSATKTLDDATGEETFNVGGTLKVGANQAPGQYTGTFTVTAAYN
jgi:spore coat protein U-like protein